MRFRILTVNKIFRLVLLFGILISLPVAGQPSFEGVIRYKILNSGEKKPNVPTESEYYLKGHNLMLRVYMETGEEMARILVIGDQKTLFMIDDVQKSAIKIRFQDVSETQPGNISEKYKEAYEKAIDEQKNKAQQLRPALKATGESEIIAGYDCKKYQIESTTQHEQPVSFIWLTDDIHFTFPESLITGDNPLLHFLGSSGFPLKLIISSNEGSMEMVATRVESGKLEDELFLIPEDYTISDMSSFIINK